MNLVYQLQSGMTCPHCRHAFSANVEHFSIAKDPEGAWVLTRRRCPNCDRLVLFLGYGEAVDGNEYPQIRWEGVVQYLVRPKVSSRLPAPSEVPAELAEDYNEASLVLPDSPKASAPLSRR